MKEKNKYESVKMKTELVNKVRESKAKTGVPLSVFFEMAAEEKLKKIENEK